MRWVGILGIVAALAMPVTAGELLLANGGRLEADLTDEVLRVSTGDGLVEVAPDSVGLLTPAEIWLKDGRIVQGTVVGGQLKARTSQGELAIGLDELGQFRADTVAVARPEAPAAAATAAPAPTVAITTEPGAKPPVGIGGGLEVVIDQSVLRRDAVAAARPVGHVGRGDRVVYIDSIDRRVRLFNAVVFDGGFWIKVRAADGTEGWLPASTVRPAR
jgi:hypothetical protein